MLTLTRAKENPILTPSDLPWEDMLVFNPGAIMVGNQVYLVYRARGKNDIKSRLGLATSIDGIHFIRNAKPMYEGNNHEHETHGIEDPRVIKIDDLYYLSYTAVSENLAGEVDPNWKEMLSLKPRIALSTTKDFVTFTDYDVIIPHLSGKNSSFFPKKVDGQFWLLYREGAGNTLFSKSDTLTNWPQGESLFNRRPGFWDSHRVGIGAPPIETEKGWLLFYHGVDESNAYRLGIMFLDLENPLKILYRSPFPVLEPVEDYEKFGFIPNVVFTCGAVEKDDLYYVYYGAADEVVGVATIEKKLVLNLF